jgi:hypothetical protein
MLVQSVLLISGRERINTGEQRRKTGGVTFLFIIFLFGRGFIILQTEKKEDARIVFHTARGTKEARYNL